MLKLTKKYGEGYERHFKGRKIDWHPLHGVVDLQIKFNQSLQEFRMDTGMASILIYLQ